MKFKLGAGLLAILFASSVYADTPQKPPSDNEGRELDPAIAKRFNLPGGCRVSLPDPKGKQARVARTAARMSAWVADQAPEIKDPPKVYLHREGDEHVLLIGPARDGVNMGTLPPDNFVKINQREGSEEPIGIIDHTKEVHWVALTNIGTVRDRLKEYKDGLGDLGMLEKMSFTVKNERPTKKIGQSLHHNADSYTVTALIINFLGQPRVFGICM
ncbi:MAG TPA: hypothetical protein VIF82_16315 [Burkholderiaceae bacterium]|jgi:hypothetical protein